MGVHDSLLSGIAELCLGPMKLLQQAAVWHQIAGGPKGGSALLMSWLPCTVESTAPGTWCQAAPPVAASATWRLAAASSRGTQRAKAHPLSYADCCAACVHWHRLSTAHTSAVVSAAAGRACRADLPDQPWLCWCTPGLPYRYTSLLPARLEGLSASILQQAGWCNDKVGLGCARTAVAGRQASAS